LNQKSEVVYRSAIVADFPVGSVGMGRTQPAPPAPNRSFYLLAQHRIKYP